MDDTLVDSVYCFLIRDLFFIKEFVEKNVVCLCDRFKKHIAVFGCLVHKCRIDVYVFSSAVIRVPDTLHFDKVNEALDLTVDGLRNNHRAYAYAVLFLKLIENACEACFGVIELVDKECLGYAGFGGIIPCEVRTDLNASLRVNRDDSAVCNSYSFLDLTNEIKITGSVYNIDLNVVPYKWSDRCGKRITSLYFFGVVVTNCVSVCNLAETIGTTCNVKHSFCY